MANGYWGKILRVNLSTQQISVDEHDEKFYRTYLGGKGIVAHYLLKEVPPDCDPLGLENILISGAMECAEHGLLPANLTGNLDLKFGSARGMLDLLNQIINREGLEDILAEGPKNIAEKLGTEAASYFMHVKGQPFPLHEPRWKAGMGIGYALSSTGAEHMTNIHDNMYATEDAPTFAAAQNLGILEPEESTELSPAKARLWTYMMLSRSVSNNACVCAFMPYSLDQIVTLVNSVTGWNFSSWELMKVSERSISMARAFNAMQGFTTKDDDLPDRCFEPLQGGTLKGQALDRRQFDATRNLIYDLLGWEQQSAAPRRWKLYELGLEWVAGMLEKQGIFKD